MPIYIYSDLTRYNNLLPLLPSFYSGSIRTIRAVIPTMQIMLHYADHEDADIYASQLHFITGAAWRSLLDKEIP